MREGQGGQTHQGAGRAEDPADSAGYSRLRIDRLPPAEKDLLQTLAVIGREFALSLIQRVVSKSEDEVDRMLAYSPAAEFIYEQPAAGDLGYIFKHAQTQEVAYKSVLSDRPRLCHERGSKVN